MSSEQVGEQELTLPVGEVYQRGGHVRGYGKEYIKATTGLTAEEITYALEHAEQIERPKERSWWDDRLTELMIELAIANYHLARLPTGQKVLIVSLGIQVVRYIVLEKLDDDDGDDLGIHHLHVGQGTSTLVKKPNGKNMLVDAGPRQNADYIRNYLNERGINHVDSLVLTHNHSDHISGVIGMVENEDISVGTIYHTGIRADTDTQEKVEKAIEDSDDPIETKEIHRGSGDLSSSGVAVGVLNPPQSPDNSDDMDANSMVLQVSYGDTNFLLPSDIRSGTEEDLIEEYITGLESTVMQASHHGSKDGNSAPFLNVVEPSAVIISSSYREPDEETHPHDEALNRISPRDTYWTAVHGTVVFKSDGETVIVKTQYHATTSPDAIVYEEEANENPYKEPVPRDKYE